jgi:type IV pilus assembly protein PilY1
MVTVTNPNTGADMTLPFVIGANPDSALEGKAPLPLKSLPNIKSRAYWYLQQ